MAATLTATPVEAPIRPHRICAWCGHLRHVADHHNGETHGGKRFDPSYAHTRGYSSTICDPCKDRISRQISAN